MPKLPGLLAALGLLLTLPADAGANQKSAGQAEQCLACHGQPGMQSESGRIISINAAKHAASVHASLDCTVCHTGIREFPHPQPMPRVDCASCHGDIVREYELGVHAAVRRSGDTEGATCQSCHGPVHEILPASAPQSPVAKKNLPDTCGSCHANAEFLARHNIPFAHPVEAYRLSVHGRALAAGNPGAASCSDCHSNHAIFAARDSRSKINHWNVPQTCGTCHADIQKTYTASVHGQAVLRGVRDAPVCTDCHGEHAILAPGEAKSLVNPARVSSVTCGRCHSDERLAQRYNLPADRVVSFQGSYHGLALRAGSQTVANCASCHGVHDILPSNDPRSTVYPANLAHTCGRCHAGAGTRFAMGPVHVRAATASEHPVVKWIRLAYWVLIPLTLGFMVLHNGVDFLAKLVRGGRRERSGEEVARMNLHFRIAHWLVMLSFPVLVFTGFALKFPDSWWAQPLLQWEARFAFRGTLHRVAAVVLLASLVYHVVHLIASRRDRIILRHLRPGIQDLSDLVDVLRYNLGFSSRPPSFGKFSYAEKIEYLAFVWGSVVMAVSGFLLWFNNFTLRHFPKWLADAATAVHYYEAILATLSILLWHFYTTIFDPDVYPMDRSWLTGETSAEHLRLTRPAYYLELLLQQLLQSSKNAVASRKTDEQKKTPAPEDRDQ